MNSETICLSSQTIDIAENDLYLELTNRMCYFDDENLNHILLPYKDNEEHALQCAQTLINMPVQAKYRKINGVDDLGSHEMHVTPDGEVVFDTDSVGVHTDVWIEDTEVVTVHGETKTLPCLYAKKRIWKRNKNLINAIKRLYESESGLGSSWEIQTLSYTYDRGVKTLTDYVFMSDCLLGSTTTPAYSGTAKAISLSAISEQELMVADALSQDILANGLSNNNQEKEDTNLKDNENKELSTENNVTVENSELENSEAKNQEVASLENKEPGTTDTAEENENTSEEQKVSTEVSALTSYDLRRKVNDACRAKYNNWCWVSYLFPEDHEVWCEYDGESELDFLKFTYSVEGDNITVSEPEKVSLTVSVKEVNSAIAEYEKTISEKDELIVQSSSEINTLKAENAELAEYKDKFNQLEQEKITAQLNQKKENLIASVVKSGQITREEIEASEEFTSYVNNLDKKSLMAIVGERLAASFDKKDESNVEVSAVKEETHVASNLNNEDDEVVDKASIMRNFLRK
ncbi:hypothetical protein [Clostridium sp. AF32-12BH]|uniref:hypothetical protein n=1 Tax=Clostridium sp. AF32-12BH TaxID=2292006 RepID=UPI000E550EA1|nr:hypothetical protein [Clostridium sp. AF32-12BH]RHP47053.1 hypothetical protein DWZ40_09125 [Clostridium sp. AF32-12BH]